VLISVTCAQAVLMFKIWVDKDRGLLFWATLASRRSGHTPLW